ACGGAGDGGGDAVAPGAEAGADAPFTGSDAGEQDGHTLPFDAAAPPVDALPANRDRLLATYLAYLKANPAPQTNGLAGGSLTGVCDLWKKLAPSPQGTFLTLTARLQGSKLASDGASMLAHVTTLYRIAGGDGATSTDPGSCGGGENNRLMMSMDSQLQDSLLAANLDKGGKGTKGKPDIADQPAGTFWRDSHDLGGAHAPFDTSDETDADMPRGQVQYFKDPSSTAAKSALGRTDLKTLVDPLALEIDQDYDCPHNSNPLCSYTLYSPICIPGAAKLGTELYTTKYGTFEPDWQPADCSPK
ncbi:MAG TPA: hypothetical protein VLT33_10375, partial [Labilithrix sp.]|nr:hypothetical protein [Labilithrix sp.]